MKSVLIVGAGVYQKPLIMEAAKQYKTFVAAPVIPDEIIDICEDVLISDVTDRDRILAFAKSKEVDGITTDQTDIAVRTVAYVADKMGLPGIGYETACLFTDKAMMRKKCSELGVQVLPYKEVCTLEEVEAFWKQYISIIIKPADNQGSRGVSKIEKQGELAERFEEARGYSKNNKVIVEKFLDGHEFVFESFCHNGVYTPLIIGDTHFFDIPNLFAANTRIFPTTYSGELLERLKKLNEKIVTGFGLKNGISHSEYITDGEDIYLIETAARGGGVFISSELIPFGSGLKTEEFLLSTALGLKMNISLERPNAVCGYIAFLLPKGEIVGLEGVQDIEKLPYVRSNLLSDIHVGDNVAFHYDKTARYSIIVVADSHDDFAKKREYIKSILKITVQDGSECRGIIWE